MLKFILWIVCGRFSIFQCQVYVENGFDVSTWGHNPSLFGVRMRKMFMFLSVFFSAQAVLAWGAAGHEAVGIIAEQNLTSAAKAKVRDLLDAGESFAKASTWPDEIKSLKGWPHTKPYHYVSVPNDENYFDALGEMSEDAKAVGDIGRTLVRAEDILRDAKTSKLEKRYALRFLIHLVGDIHQPLHVGIAEDQGGNKVDMKWNGAKVNLHAVWDFHMIDMLIDPTYVYEEGKAYLLGSDYVKALRSPSAAEISDWQNSYFTNWMNESQEMRDSAYEKLGSSNPAYFKRNIDRVNDRVLQGGYRLAAWVNAIMENRPFFSTEAVKTRQQMDRILGKYSYASISLLPEDDSKMTLRTARLIDRMDQCKDDHQ